MRDDSADHRHGKVIRGTFGSILGPQANAVRPHAEEKSLFPLLSSSTGRSKTPSHVGSIQRRLELHSNLNNFPSRRLELHSDQPNFPSCRLELHSDQLNLTLPWLASLPG